MEPSNGTEQMLDISRIVASLRRGFSFSQIPGNLPEQSINRRSETWENLLYVQSVASDMDEPDMPAARLCTRRVSIFRYTGGAPS